jgi:MFS family permease
MELHLARCRVSLNARRENLVTRPIREQEVDRGSNRLRGIRDQFGLERNVVAMSAAVFLLGAGQELWAGFLPKYLEALGASAAVIGLFGTTKDFLDGVYQYPGGLVADRIGTRRALILFSSLAIPGFVIYAMTPSWHFMFAGLMLAMAWSSMGSPAMFALIAERLPSNRRAMGFTVQAILKRLPVVVSPVLGGLLITSLGLVSGVRTGLTVTIVLALVAVITQHRFYFAHRQISEDRGPNMLKQFSSLHPILKRLLLSDILIRTCEGMAGVFVVLYVLNVTGVSPVNFGILTGIQMVTSIAAYLPAGRLADRHGRKPFVVATFLCFTLFPAAVALAPNFALLLVAFVIGGLRELGEPSRKAMIVDLADPARRGRTVGLYYLIRSLAITPAALIGGLLWQVRPSIPFFVASAFGILGTVLFATTVESHEAA